MTLAVRKEKSFIESLSIGNRAVEDELFPVDTTPSSIIPDLAFSISQSGLERIDLLTELDEVIMEARIEGWDGYGASSVLPGSIYYALQFLQQLPPNIAPPSFAVDPDGEISIEWDYGRRRIFSVSVGEDGTLNYAGLIGHRSFHGEEPLAWGIPKRILDGINSVV